MLTALRSKASSWVVRILFVVLILTFALWGIGDIFRVGGRETDLAKIGPLTISVNQFQEEYQRELRRFGGQIDSETAKQLGIHRQLLDAMVSRALLQVETDRLGLAIGEAQIRDAILNDQNFYNDAGRFDRARFDFALRQAGLSEAAYSRLISDDLMRQQLLSALAEGVVLPQETADQLYQYRAQTRVAEILSLPQTAAGPVPQATDADLQTYYQANQSLYQAPEYRAATVLILDPKIIGGEITITDEEVRRSFDERPGAYDVAEKRTLQQVVFGDEAMANQFIAQVKGGKSFEDAAKETGQSVIDLGTVTKTGLPVAELADPAFALPVQTPSAPVKSALGWHVVITTVIEAGKIASFDEVKDRIKAELAQAKAIDSMIALGNDVQDRLAAGSALAEIAADLRLETVKIEAIDALGQDRQGNPIDKIDLPIIQTIATTDEGQDSGLIDLPDGRAIVVHVNGVIPAAPRAFDEVKDRVQTNWVEAERAKLLQALADKLVDRVNQGADLDAVAAEYKATVKTSQPVTRDGSDEAVNLTPAMAAQLFTMKPGAAATFAEGAEYGVLQLKEVKPADPAAAKEETAKILADIRAQAIGDLTAQFGVALRQSINVEIDDAALDRLP